MIDTTEIGVVAAKVMEDLEQMQHSGEVAEDARVVAALVIYELSSTDSDGDRASTVGGRCTGDRNVLGLGLVARMNQALLSPDEDD